MAKSWQVKCPHCRENFVLDEQSLGLAHMKVGLVVLQSPAGVSEWTENYSIACRNCGKTMPFEPRSRFRRRKAVAVEQKLQLLAKMYPGGPAGEGAIAVALKAGDAFLQMMQTDFPLETVREMAEESTRVLAADAEAGRPELKNHPAIRAFHEILAIACADVGELKDLPEPAAEKLEEARVALLGSVEKLNATPAAAKDKPAAAEKLTVAEWIALAVILALLIGGYFLQKSR